MAPKQGWDSFKFRRVTILNMLYIFPKTDKVQLDKEFFHKF